MVAAGGRVDVDFRTPIYAASQHRIFCTAAGHFRASLSDTLPPWSETAAAPAAPAAPDLTPSRPLYDGSLGELYAIYLRHIVMMLLTFGWSRFWGRTRLRRYVWNHLSILGDRFEYRGRGRELLIGFLLAVVMLAAWAGLMWLVWIKVFHEKPFASFGLFDIFSLSV